jgi:hypothetical protein
MGEDVGVADLLSSFWQRQRGADETIQVGRALIAEVRKYSEDELPVYKLTIAQTAANKS